jgi:hypothetical protein
MKILYKDSLYYFNIKKYTSTIVALKREIKVYLKRFISTLNNKEDLRDNVKRIDKSLLRILNIALRGIIYI